MDSTIIIPSPSRRHHFSSNLGKSPHMRTLSSARNHTTATTPTSTKRSYASDENSDPSLAFLASPSKRVKAVLSSNLNTALKSASALQAQTISRPPKRAFGALIDVTNTRASSPARQSEKQTYGKPRTILKPLSAIKKTPSPPRPRAPSPRLGSGRGIKRAHSPPIVRRINPPTSLSTPSSSIDSILSDATAPPLIAPNIPDSWVFDIYQDSPEETLQNLMEHSAHTLDISDSESQASELHERGKENIHPDRMAELVALADIPQRRAPGAGPGGRVLREHREALREMRKEELVAAAESVDGGVRLVEVEKAESVDGGVRLPSLTPEKPKSPEWAIWESDHEGEKSDG